MRVKALAQHGPKRRCTARTPRTLGVKPDKRCTTHLAQRHRTLEVTHHLAAKLLQQPHPLTNRTETSKTKRVHVPFAPNCNRFDTRAVVISCTFHLVMSDFLCRCLSAARRRLHSVVRWRFHSQVTLSFAFHVALSNGDVSIACIVNVAVFCSTLSSLSTSLFLTTTCCSLAHRRFVPRCVACSFRQCRHYPQRRFSYFCLQGRRFLQRMCSRFCWVRFMDACTFEI